MQMNYIIECQISSIAVDEKGEKFFSIGGQDCSFRL